MRDEFPLRNLQEGTERSDLNKFSRKPFSHCFKNNRANIADNFSHLLRAVSGESKSCLCKLHNSDESGHRSTFSLSILSHSLSCHSGLGMIKWRGGFVGDVRISMHFLRVHSEMNK